MPTPSTRTPVRIARGSYSNLNGSVSDLHDGEISYAEDQNTLYIKEGSSLVSLTFAPASPTFTGDVTFTGAANNVVFDASDNALEFADNAKATFGGGGDLQLFHDGNHSYVQDAGTGDLYLRGTNSVIISGTSTGQTLGQFIEGDGCVFRFNNTIRLQTTNTGASITGTLVAGGFTAYDNEKILLGTNNDLEIFHDGTNNIIQSDTGALQINAGDSAGNVEINLNNNVSGNTKESSAKFIKNGAVELYHDNVKKFETQASGIDVTGTVGCDKIVIDGPYQQVAEALGALDVNCGNGNYFTKTISANSTFTFSNPPSSGTSFAFTLELTHSSGTVTWPSSVKWNKDTAPTLTAGKTHLFMFVTDDGGTRWRGSALVDYVN